VFQKKKTSLLQPLKDIYQYKKVNSTKALYQGFCLLWAREFIYISTISIINPLVTHQIQSQYSFQSKRSKHIVSIFGVFSCGFAAGLVSAPFQTLNVLMKDEVNKGKKITEIFKQDIIQTKSLLSNFKRLFFGAATRSCRCGGAGVLYYSWRQTIEEK